MRLFWSISLRRLAGSMLALCAIVIAMPTPTSAAETVRIGVQYGVPYVPFYVAEADKIFERNFAAEGKGQTGVSFSRFSGSTALNDAIISGQIDMAVYGTTGFLVAWDRTKGSNSEVIGLSGVTVMPFKMIAVKPELKTIRDLAESDRVSIPALISPSAFVLRMAAEKVFGKSDALDARIVTLPNPDGVSQLLGGKSEVTAWFGPPPYWNFLLKQPRAHVVLSSESVFGGASSSFILAVRKRYADENPGLVRAVLKTLDEANETVARDPKRAAGIYLKFEPSKQMGAEFVTEVLTAPENTFRTDVLGIMKYVDFMSRTGAMKNRPADWKEMFLPYIHDRPGS